MININTYITEKFKINKDINNNLSVTEKISDLFSGFEVFDNKKDDIMKEINSFLNKSEYNEYSLYTSNECSFADEFEDYFTDKVPRTEFSRLIAKYDIFKDTSTKKFNSKNTQLEITFNEKSNSIYMCGFYPTKYFREILIVLEK